ncbi:MAG: hypothetical protein QM790_16120 [Nibricoccus sp.]
MQKNFKILRSACITLLVIVGLMAVVFFSLVLGKDGAIGLRLWKRSNAEEKRAKDYAAVMMKIEAEDLGSEPGFTEKEMIDDVYTFNGVTIRNLGVVHTYEFFTSGEKFQNARHITSAISTGNWFAKEDLILNGTMLSDYARKKGKALLNLNETRSREPAVLGLGYCVMACIVVPLSMFFIFRGIAEGRKRERMRFAFWGLCTLVQVVAIIACVRTWYPAVDWSGGQKFDLNSNVVTRITDRYWKDFWQRAEIDSRSMFKELLASAQQAPSGTSIVVLSGNRHAFDIRRLMQQYPAWAIKRQLGGYEP